MLTNNQSNELQYTINVPKYRKNPSHNEAAVKRTFSTNTNFELRAFFKRKFIVLVRGNVNVTPSCEFCQQVFNC